MYKIPANFGFTSNYIHYLPSCHSTNEVATNLLANGAEEGTVIITDNQTNGKGQRGNFWESDPFFNLTFSLILKPNFLPVQNQFQLIQVISISIVEAIQGLVSKTVKVKWPNDIYVGDKKIGGILIQNTVKGKRIESSVIGMGLNINQTIFQTPNATSIKALMCNQMDLNDVLNGVLKSIAENYLRLKNGEQKAIGVEYYNLLLGLNETRNFKAEESFSGKIIGVDAQGRLLIETGRGIRCFQNQEVKFV